MSLLFIASSLELALGEILTKPLSGKRHCLCMEQKIRAFDLAKQLIEVVRDINQTFKTDGTLLVSGFPQQEHPRFPLLTSPTQRKLIMCTGST